MADRDVNHQYNRFVRNAPAYLDANTIANKVKTEPGIDPTAPTTQAAFRPFTVKTEPGAPHTVPSIFRPFPPYQQHMHFNPYAPYMRNTVPTMMLPNVMRPPPPLMKMRVPPPPPPPPPLMNFASGGPPTSSHMPPHPWQVGRVSHWRNPQGPRNYPFPRPPLPLFHPAAQPMQNPEFYTKSSIKQSLDEQEKIHELELKIWTRMNQEKEEKLGKAQLLIQQKETEKNIEIDWIQEEKEGLKTQVIALAGKIREMTESKDVRRHIEQLDIKSKRVMELEAKIGVLQQLKNKEIGQWKVQVDQLNLKLKEAKSALLLEQQKPEKVQTTVDGLRSQIKSIQRELNKSKEQVETLTEQLSSRTKEFVEMSSTVDNLEITIQTQASEISSLQEDFKKEQQESEIILNERINAETELRLSKEQVKALRDEKTVEQTKWETEIHRLGFAVQCRSSEVARLYENLTEEQLKSAMIQKEKSDVESKLKLSEEQVKETLHDEKTKWKAEKDRLTGDISLLFQTVTSLKTALKAVAPRTSQERINELQQSLDEEKKKLTDAKIKFDKSSEALIEANDKICKLTRRLGSRPLSHDVDLGELQNRRTEADLTEEHQEWNANRQSAEQTFSQLVSRINELVAVTLTMKKELREYKAAELRDKELEGKDKDPKVKIPLVTEKPVSDPSKLVELENKEEQTGSSKSSSDKELTVKKELITEQSISVPPRKRGRPPKYPDQGPAPAPKKSKLIN